MDVRGVLDETGPCLSDGVIWIDFDVIAEHLDFFLGMVDRPNLYECDLRFTKKRLPSTT
jgi:hypothetical protein